MGVGRWRRGFRQCLPDVVFGSERQWQPLNSWLCCMYSGALYVEICIYIQTHTRLYVSLPTEASLVINKLELNPNAERP